jgi:Cdc6-like AAA superfamily ATPase
MADANRVPPGSINWKELDSRLGKAFTPAVPVSEETLFAGRLEQIRLIMNAVNQRGQHVIVYGERGVGKTSLANILSSRIGAAPGDPDVLTPRVTCDTTDDFTSLWRKVFAQVDMIKKKRAPGFSNTLFEETKTATDVVPDSIKPDDVRRLLTFVGDEQTTILIFDEFDRVTNPKVRRAVADTVKVLSDHDVPTTMILVGVADTVGELIAEHRSIERALVQIKMPRMAPNELIEILQLGTDYAGMSITDEAADAIARLSQGFPNYTHMLGLWAGHVAIDQRSVEIERAHLKPAVERAVANAQESLLEDYRRAVSSPQPDNLFSRVLLACALAEHDRFGYFAAADVRDPLSELMKKEYRIPSFARHLKEFCEPSRGPVLRRSGEKRKFKYRFVSPLMQPFAIMQGMLEGHIANDSL